MDNKLWVLVPYMRPVRNSRRWQAEPWKGAPPAKIDGMLVFLEPETALASHLEGVHIAGRLDEYIRGIEEKGWSRSKKTRDRKAGLAKVLPAMVAWDGYAKYASVQQVMEAVKSSQSSWQDTPDSPTKRAKRGGADPTEGSGGVGGKLKDTRATADPPTTRAKRGGADTTEDSGGVGGEIKDTRATADPPTKRGGADTTEGSGGVGGELKDLLESMPEHMLEQLKRVIQAQMTARGVGAGTTTHGACAERKPEARDGHANDTQTSTNTQEIPAQLTSAGAGADTIGLRVSAKRKAEVIEGKANDTQTSTNTEPIQI